MSNVPPVIATHVCAHCGARSQTQDGKCWLCFESKSDVNPYASAPSDVPAYSPADQTSKWDGLFSAILVICVVLTVLIAIGLGVQDRGLLIPFAICVGPAYLITLIRGAFQASDTGKVRPGRLLRTFAVSLVVTFMVFTVLVAAAAILACAMCFVALSQMHH